MRIITFGTYDLFHIGHLNILKRCKEHGSEKNTLIVGVSSDSLNIMKKKRYPVISQDDRMNIISSIRYVDHVFLEESLEEKLDYCLKYNADTLIMGDDHIGRFDFLKEHNINVLYLKRTENVSTTEILDKIKI